MVWCTHCGDDCERDPDKGYICCIVCGKVLDQDVYYSDPMLEKTSSGQSRMAGSILHGAKEKMLGQNANTEHEGISLKPTSDSTRCAPRESKEAKISRHRTASDSTCYEREQDLNQGFGDPESLSDIDDVEVDGYLHNEKEKHYKKIIWEELNKEYLEEQAAKQAAAAKKASEAAFVNNFEELHSAQELAAATAATLANSKRGKRQKRAAEKRNSAPAKSPLEATCQVLKRKPFSSKINYKALESLYKASEKKQRTEIDAEERDSIEEKTFEEKTFEEKGKESYEEVERGDEDDLGEHGKFEDPFDGDDDDYYDGDYHEGNGEDAYYGNVDDDYYGNGDDDYD